MNKIISIIGHRDSPPEILETIEKIAGFFAKKGWILRTGGAEGVDEAARQGYLKADKSNNIELYLPWQGYNDLRGLLWTQENWDEAAKHHPKWNSLKGTVKQLHARNMSIILGLDNKSPSDLIVAYTRNGEEVGGTATGIRCGKAHGILIFNLGDKTDLTKLRKWCKKL